MKPTRTEKALLAVKRKREAADNAFRQRCVEAVLAKFRAGAYPDGLGWRQVVYEVERMKQARRWKRCEP